MPKRPRDVFTAMTAWLKKRKHEDYEYYDDLSDYHNEDRNSLEELVQRQRFGIVQDKILNHPDDVEFYEVFDTYQNYESDVKFIESLANESADLAEIIKNDPEKRRILFEAQQDIEHRTTQYEASLATIQKDPLRDKIEWSLAFLDQKEVIEYIVANNYSDIPYFAFAFQDWYSRFVISKHFSIAFPVVPFRLQAQMTNACGAPNESTDEKLAMKIQTSASKGESYKINQQVRGLSNDIAIKYSNQTQDIPFVVHHLDNLLCSPELTKLSQPIFVYRGTTEPMLVDPGYKSVSLDPQTALSFCQEACILFQIELPAGFPIQKICSYNSEWKEMEILLSRKTQFVPLGGSFRIFMKDRSYQVIRVRAVFKC